MTTRAIAVVLGCVSLVVAAGCEANRMADAPLDSAHQSVPEPTGRAGQSAGANTPEPLPVEREVAFWENRVARDPHDYKAQHALGTSYLRLARDSGRTSYNQRAEGVLRRALAQASRPSYDGLVALSFALNAQHRFAEGARVAADAVALRPEALTGYGTLGDALFELGDVAGARRAYDKAIDLDGGLFALTRMARLKRLVGDTRGALDDLEYAVELGRERGAPPKEIARCLVQIGGVYFVHGDLDRAEEHYRKGLELWPDGFLPQEHLAEMRAVRGDLEGAVKLYREVIDRVPSPEFLLALGDVYAELGEREKAEQFTDRALEIYLERTAEGDQSYYRHLATFFSDRRPDPARALEWARRDLENRQDVYTYDTLAWALYRNGMFEEALDAATRALEHRTPDPALWRHAAMIHEALGNDEAARRHHARADRITEASP